MPLLSATRGALAEQALEHLDLPAQKIDGDECLVQIHIASTKRSAKKSEVMSIAAQQRVKPARSTASSRGSTRTERSPGARRRGLAAPAVQSFVNDDEPRTTKEAPPPPRTIAAEEEHDGAAQGVEAELLPSDGDEDVEGAPQFDWFDGGVERTRCGQKDHRGSIIATHAPRRWADSVTGKRRMRPSGKTTSQVGSASIVRGTRRSGAAGARSRRRQRYSVPGLRSCSRAYVRTVRPLRERASTWAGLSTALGTEIASGIA